MGGDGDAKTGSGCGTLFLSHLALFGANCIFGAGNVVGKIGLNGINPILFALVREAIAGPLLILLAWYLEPQVKVNFRNHWWRFVITGLGLFGTNFCYIVGVKLAGATTAAIWQPAQPIFITALAVFLGYEKTTALKLFGILVACGGCLFVTLYGATANFSGNQAVGNVVFFAQCLACSAFYVSEKPLLKLYPPLTILGYAYMCATVLMVTTASIVNEIPDVLHFVCPDCHGNGWSIPNGAWVAIAYWVFLGSIVGYLLNTWGNQHVDASLLGVYAVVQPVITVIVASIAIAFSSAPHWGLEGLRVSDFGAIGIFSGLLIVSYDNSLQRKGRSSSSIDLLDKGSNPEAALLSNKFEEEEN